ncbi:MAG: response regulator [Chloroflexi bacterium]|nr:response regulator [Chloroflexota bacterium]
MIASAGQVPTRKTRIVLVVDSDPEVVHILELNLAHANMKVISAGNGTEALAKASTETPDVILIDEELPDLEAAEICRHLKESPQTGHIPVIVFVGAQGHSGAEPSVVDGADDYISKPFDPKEVMALVEACSKRVERAENTNPLTGLPNQFQVNSELSRLMEQNKTFAAIYVDMDDLRAFNKVYGFAQGDRTLRLLAEVLGEAVRLFGNPDDLVGHFGGDNLVIVTTTQKARILCRRIIADFDSRIRTLYRRKDLERGYIEYEGRLGRKERSPVMCLRAAVVSNDKRTFFHPLEVSEAASEQIDYLRRFPTSNCYFDLHEGGVDSQLNSSPKGTMYTHRAEVRALQGVLAWVTFLTKELDVPVTVIKDCLDGVEPALSKNLTPKQQGSLKAVRDNINQLDRIVEELTNLGKGDWVADSAVLRELDIVRMFDWVKEHLKELSGQRKIRIEVGPVSIRDPLVVDARSLIQGLFYVIRSEINCSSPGDQIDIRAFEKRKGFAVIEISNRNRNVPPRDLVHLLQGQLEGVLAGGQRNDLYPAKVLLQGIGGELNVESPEGDGTTFVIQIPKRWQSSKEEVNTLLSAAETSRKEARSQLESLNQMVPSVKESLERVSHRVQELSVLCNRSLFLADDLSNRLEAQQDWLLQQEVSQLAMCESILVACREIARSMHVAYLFDSESAQRVAKYAAALADEFKMSRSEQQSLHYAASLKDLGLVSSPEDMVEQMVIPTPEKAIALRARFNFVWKGLSQVDFLARSLVLISHRYERYDGTGRPAGLKGDNIPLGARILAAADTFDSMVSGLLPRGTLAPGMALKKLVAERRFDPDVVNAFIRILRRRELNIAVNKSI